MLEPRRIRCELSSLTACCCFAAFVCVLVLQPSPAYSYSDGSREFAFVALLYVGFSLLRPFVIPALLLALLFRFRPTSKNGAQQTEQHNLERHTIALTEEQRGIMERFGVTYEDYKFHYEGKAYNSLNDVPLK